MCDKDVATVKRKRKATKDDPEPDNAKKAKRATNKKSAKECKDENINTEALEPLWTTHGLLAEQQNLNFDTASSIVSLFEDGNTIPFIVRYRKHCIENMTADQLRDIKCTYEEICHLKEKIRTVSKALEKSGSLTSGLQRSVRSACSLEELEYVYAPYKTGSKSSLAERAKNLGLEEPAQAILQNANNVNLYMYVQSDNKSLKTIEDVKKGIGHILASIVATDTEVLSLLRQLRTTAYITIKTKMCNTKTDIKDKIKKTKAKATTSKNTKPVDESKFETYSNFEASARFIKPHQVLAINRGEALKVLSVKVIIPDDVHSKYSDFCKRKWIRSVSWNALREAILLEAIEDAYNRLLQPLMVREVRSELKQRAEKASYEVFMSNLKQLLLAPPLKGKTILAIDPGFANGCKLALVSPAGQLLDSNVIHPHRTKSDSGRDVSIIKDMILSNSCDIIALGNGTACRQTEEWLSDLIKNGVFKPLNVQYIIVNEDGASIYSCSAEAKKEFPKLDPNIISSISLARRVQEPLAELVKIEPKHLGIGMYQHDLKNKNLEEAVNDVISECVSFVGVNLNTTSQCLLRHIAGLTDKRATKIIDFRVKNGSFACRKQLLDVTGIGPKIFQQCAGFLRVGPLTKEDARDFYKSPRATKLDSTDIHPESYDVARGILKILDLKEGDIGETSFINTVKVKLSSIKVPELSKTFETKEETVQLILNTFCKPLNHDFRTESKQVPLFRKSVTNLNAIQIGDSLTGRITNVTHFGSFVDIGVGTNGLIHISKYNRLNLQIGNRVEVKVIDVDLQRKRIALEAVSSF